MRLLIIPNGAHKNESYTGSNAMGTSLASSLHSPTKWSDVIACKGGDIQGMNLPPHASLVVRQLDEASPACLTSIHLHLV
jgi:hypothetical protein